MPGAEKNIINYDEDTSRNARQYIDRMEANLGGTDILTPLNKIKGWKRANQNLKRRVFILTDGQVRNPQEVINQASEDA